MCIFVIYKTKKLINIAYLRKELRTKTTLGELEELFAKSSPDALCAIFSEVKGFLCVLLLFFFLKKKKFSQKHVLLDLNYTIICCPFKCMSSIKCTQKKTILKAL